MLFTRPEVRIDKYFSEVSKTAQGRSPRDVFETEGKHFLSGPTKMINNVLISCQKQRSVYYNCACIQTLQRRKKIIKTLFDLLAKLTSVYRNNH